MTGEIPPAERESTPEGHLFDVEAMSDDEIIVLSRGLTLAGDNGGDIDDHLDQTAIGDGLHAKLVTEMSALATRDSERVKRIVHCCMLSDNEADQDFAAYVASSLVHYDYGFTRDTLIYSVVDFANHGTRADRTSETARNAIRKLMRDHLSPEQIDDFNSRLTFFGGSTARVDPGV